MATYKTNDPKTGLKRTVKLTPPQKTYGEYPETGVEVIDGNPTELELTLKTSSIDLSLSNGSTNEDGIIIEESADGSPLAAITVVAPETESYVDEDVTADSEYSYRLLSYKGNSTSLHSNVATLLFEPIDGNPSSLVATGGETSIGLEWVNGSTNEEGINIERSVDEETFAIIDTVDPAETTYTDTTAEAEITYYYRVVAFKSTSFSEASNVADAALTTGD